MNSFNVLELLTWLMVASRRPEKRGRPASTPADHGPTDVRLPEERGRPADHGPTDDVRLPEERGRPSAPLLLEILA